MTTNYCLKITPLKRKRKLKRLVPKKKSKEKWSVLKIKKSTIPATAPETMVGFRQMHQIVSTRIVVPTRRLTLLIWKQLK
jgi:hypothetical protein